MMKLLFARLLPGAVAVGIFTTALSPVKPALAMFAAAADALAGETQGQTEVLGTPSLPPVPGVTPETARPAAGKAGKRRSLENFANQLEGGEKKEDYGWNPGDRAPKPIQLKGPDGESRKGPAQK